ncbi:MAG: ABC transporter substrate-binding protein [Ruminococcus sp.]|jgi:iron complex transport system substrate-binding protein|nr:ABC transporter substrate-binding protein [Ruminococcus sp.]
MKKFAVILLIILTLAACDNAHYTEYGGEITAVSGEELTAMSIAQIEAEEKKKQDEAEIEQLISESEAQLAALTIADRMGGTVKVPESKNLRVVSTTPAATEILAGLGLLENIIAADMNSADVPGIAPEICGLDMMHLNTQYIADLSPDIVIIGEISQKDFDPLGELKEMGIYTAFIPSSNSIEGIKMDIEFLAGLTGTADKGFELISEINTDLLYIEEIIADAPVKFVLFTVAEEPEIYAVGDNNFMADMISRAGGQTALAGDTGFVKLTAEEIAAITNIDIYITNANADNPDYAYVDTSLTSRPSQNITKGVLELAKIIHPELFNVTEEIAA